MKNLKGFVFTVDAIFSLVIAAAATSILLLSLYSPTTPIEGPTTEAFSVSQNFMQASIGQAAGTGGTFASYAALGWLSQQYTWPQYGNNASLSSGTAGYGPQIPLVLFSYQVPNAINPNIAVADGLVVFTTNALGSSLYAINASTGALVFNVLAVNSVFIGPPAIYQGIIYTANSGGYVKAYTETGNPVWSTSVTSSWNGIYLDIENGALDVNQSFINPFNGTLIKGSPQSVMSAYLRGGYFSFGYTGSTTANVYAYSLYGGALQTLWVRSLTTTASTYITPITLGGNELYGALTKSGTPTVFANTIGGGTSWSSALSTSPTGAISYANNNIYLVTTNSVYGFTATGTQLFATGATWTNNYNLVPVATPNIFYALINGNILVAYSETSGKQLWSATLPAPGGAFSYTPSSIAVAYGNLYFAAGNTIYAIGTCKADSSESVLQAIATMYLNKQGGCATMLLNQTYKSNNVAVFINNSYAPSLYTAQFTGANFIQTMSNESAKIAGSALTLDIWVNPSGSPAANSVYAGFINNVNANFYLEQKAGTNTVISGYRGSGGTAYFGNTINTTITPYKWNNIALIFNGTAIITFVNGVRKSTALASSYITNNGVAFTMGGDLISSAPAAYTGLMSDVQLYNINLTAAQVQAIYLQGIGAVPIAPSNIVAWYPLQGDTNDYAKYSYGIPSNVAAEPSLSSVTSFGFAPFLETPPGLLNSYQISRASVPLSVNVNGNYLSYNVSVVVWR